MSSWRDETSPAVQGDLDDLLDAAIRAAQELLDSAGEFYPFAVALEGAGETRVLAAEVPTGPREVADPSAVLDLCWDGLRAESGELRAAAVASNVGGPDGDAIAVALEHREGPAIEVFLPYAVQPKVGGKKPPQKLLYGDLQAIPGQQRVWV